MPARFIISRLSIIPLSPKLVRRDLSPQDADNLRLFHSQNRNSLRINFEGMLVGTRAGASVAAAKLKSIYAFGAVTGCDALILPACLTAAHSNHRAAQRQTPTV